MAAPQIALDRVHLGGVDARRDHSEQPFRLVARLLDRDDSIARDGVEALTSSKSVFHDKRRIAPLQPRP